MYRRSERDTCSPFPSWHVGILVSCSHFTQAYFHHQFQHIAWFKMILMCLVCWMLQTLNDRKLLMRWSLPSTNSFYHFRFFFWAVEAKQITLLLCINAISGNVSRPPINAGTQWSVCLSDTGYMSIILYIPASLIRFVFLIVPYSVACVKFFGCEVQLK